jgi:hypothetical protein
MIEYKGHKGLKRRKTGGSVKAEPVKGSEGNKKVLAAASEGLKGGGHIAGGAREGGLGRKRGGGVGADQNPFSSAHKRGGKCE